MREGPPRVAERRSVQVRCIKPEESYKNVETCLDQHMRSRRSSDYAWVGFSTEPGHALMVGDAHAKRDTWLMNCETGSLGCSGSCKLWLCCKKVRFSAGDDGMDEKIDGKQRG